MFALVDMRTDRLIGHFLQAILCFYFYFYFFGWGERTADNHRLSDGGVLCGVPMGYRGLAIPMY